jgi:DNA-binding transcriptional regulator YhcF (GntR family)
MLLRVDFKSGQPVYLQLVGQIKSAAATGALRADETLPAIGALAKELRVSRNNVAKAYAELEASGIIEMVPGKGYCLKAHHRPLRKEISRTEPAGGAIQPAARHKARTTLTYSLLTFLLGALYFAVVAILGATLVRAGVVRGEIAAVIATVVVAAGFLPLRSRLQQALSRVIFPKRERVPRALQSLKSEFWSQANLDSFLECVLKTSEEVVGVRPELVRDHGAVVSLVNSFPSLRSSREPISAGNGLLMPLFSHDEVIGVLRLAGQDGHHGYDPEDWQFLTGVGEQVSLAANQFRVRNERMESEYALDIQRGLLPREVPQVAGYQIASAWQPAKNVGGDYYDVFRVGGDSSLALIVADVSGKGMPAALLMANLQATTKAYASLHPKPAELCACANRAICESISAGKFITFFYAILDANRHRLVYTNAGHNPPLLVSRDGTCRKLETGGMVLGLFAGSEYEQAAVDLQDGDRLVIFTDGVIEAADSSEKEFGEDRLFTVTTSRPSVTANQLRDSIMEAVTHFCRGDFADDATLLTVVANHDNVVTRVG